MVQSMAQISMQQWDDHGVRTGLLQARARRSTPCLQPTADYQPMSSYPSLTSQRVGVADRITVRCRSDVPWSF